MKRVIALVIALTICAGILSFSAVATDESDAEKIIRFQDVEAYHGSFSTIYLKSGESATLPGVPEDGPYYYYNTDYSFVGWSTVKGAKTPEYYEGDTINADDFPDGETVLYGVCRLEKIRVEFVQYTLENGYPTWTYTSVEAERSGSGVTAPAGNPNETLFNFKGWSAEKYMERFTPPYYDAGKVFTFDELLEIRESQGTWKSNITFFPVLELKDIEGLREEFRVLDTVYENGTQRYFEMNKSDFEALGMDAYTSGNGYMEIRDLSVLAVVASGRYAVVGGKLVDTQNGNAAANAVIYIDVYYRVDESGSYNKYDDYATNREFVVNLSVYESTTAYVDGTALDNGKQSHTEAHLRMPMSGRVKLPEGMAESVSDNAYLLYTHFGGWKEGVVLDLQETGGDIWGSFAIEPKEMYSSDQLYFYGDDRDFFAEEVETGFKFRSTSEYSELGNVFYSIKEGNTARLLKGYEGTTTWSLWLDGRKITLDLGGQELRTSAPPWNIKQGPFTIQEGELEITGEGRIVFDGTGAIVSAQYPDYDNGRKIPAKVIISGNPIITYVGENGEGLSALEENECVVKGGTFSFDPSAFVADGYIAVEIDNIIPEYDGDTCFIVRESRTVTYKDGDTVLAEITCVQGAETPKIDDPEKAGSVFIGWSPELSETVTENAVYTAVWAVQPPVPVPAPADPTVKPALITNDHVVYLRGNRGSFRPLDSLTRAEAAQVIYNLLEDKTMGDKEASFADVSEDGWYYSAVTTLASHGIINGYPDGTFRPDQHISRAEFVSICARFFDLEAGEIDFTDVAESSWAYDDISGAYHMGWINGYPDGCFRPNDDIKRTEVAAVINRVLGRTPDKAFIDSHAEELKGFDDVTKSHWNYYGIMEAANGHGFEISDGAETWTELR